MEANERNGMDLPFIVLPPEKRNKGEGVIAGAQMQRY
jgi:hypothetical protein